MLSVVRPRSIQSTAILTLVAILSTGIPLQASPASGVYTKVQGGGQGAGASASYTTRDGGSSGDSTTPSNQSIFNASDTRSTSVTPGFTTAFSQTQQSADHNGDPPFVLSSSDFARASLDEGTLKASVSSTNGYDSFAESLLFDTLTFNVPGADDSTQTTVHFRFGLGGTRTTTNFGSSAIFRLSPGGLGSFLFDAPFPSFSNGDAKWEWSSLQDRTFTPSPNSQSTWTLLDDTPTSYLVDGAVTLTGAHPVLGLAADLQLDVNSNLFETNSKDFSHTASISVNLPPGVMFSSSSGVFLAVPEPCSICLAAFGGLLIFARKSKRKTAGR